MSASTKLSTAVQALCHLAMADSTPQSSDCISRVTGIHASRLRSILSMLSHAGIVDSARGLSGGFTLAKDPENIHLQEIYCAVETRKAFHLDVGKDIGASLAGGVNGYFIQLFSDIQVEIEDKMRTITLRSILDSIEHYSSTLPSSGRG